jgi:hypothetical protein
MATPLTTYRYQQFHIGNIFRCNAEMVAAAETQKEVDDENYPTIYFRMI